MRARFGAGISMMLALLVSTQVTGNHNQTVSIGRQLVSDFVDFNKNIISVETAKIILGFVPVYTVARVFDKQTHSFFYCHKHHKNKRQLPTCAYHSVDVGLGVVMVSLASLSFWGSDELTRHTARLYIETLPYTWLIKKLLKEIKFCGGERPKNEWFCKNKTTYGGCPSGHMMEMVYTTALFGTQLGPKAAIPLGIFTAAVGFEFINCNRHYLSQLVAGAGLGLIFASAANKIINAAERHNCQISVVGDGGSCAVRAQYSF